MVVQQTGDATITENNDLSATAEVQESHDHVIDATMAATDAVRACDSSDPQLIELPLNSAKVGMWVKVVYEEETFLGKITDLWQLKMAVKCDVSNYHMQWQGVALNSKGSMIGAIIQKFTPPM